MPHDRIANLSGVKMRYAGEEIDHNPRHSASCARLSESEMREFLKEEQMEGKHPSLQGKRF